MSSRRIYRFSTLLMAATVLIGSAVPGAGASVINHIQTLHPTAASNDLDARQGSIHERMRDAMEAGRLTDDDMHSIKEQLQKVAAQEATFKSKNGGELTGWQSMQLQVDLDKISKELEADLTERKGGPVDVVAESNQIATRLTDALAVAKLTQAEYDQFSAALKVINDQITAAKEPNGKIATNDQVRIALELDNLSQRFTAGEHQRKADMTLLDQRKDQLHAEIRGGVADGDLTEDEVDDLRQQLYNFEDKEARMGAIGRPLTADEELSMALELERFDAEIRARMDNGTNVKITERTIGYRKNALDQTFANALFSGDLTVAEAQDFKSNLEQITQEEATLRAGNNGQLTPDAIRSLLITVEKLKGRFSRLTYNRQKPWLGVDGTVNQIKLKIMTATAANKLTVQESDDLQSKIADVLVAKSNERNTQGFVTTDSALKLQAEITKLDSDVTNEIANRSSVSTPNLKQRQLQVGQKLAEGIDLGKLTPVQASALVANYKTIVADEAKLQSADGTIDENAAQLVSTDIDNLAAAIRQTQGANSAPRVTMDEIKSECDREITYRTYDGKLPTSVTQGLRAEYNRLDKIEKTARARPNGLDAVTAMTLITDLNKLLKTTKSYKRGSSINTAKSKSPALTTTTTTNTKSKGPALTTTTTSTTKSKSPAPSAGLSSNP